MAAQSKSTPTRGRAQRKAKDTSPENAPGAALDAAAPPAGPQGKLGAMIALLRRPGGVQISEVMAETGWQAHSVRGAISGAIKKKHGLTVVSEKTEAGRIYRIIDPMIEGGE